MAKARKSLAKQFKKANLEFTESDCIQDFGHDAEAGTYQKIEAIDLQKSCENFKNLLNREESVKTFKDQFCRSGFFPVKDLLIALGQTKGNYVKVYSAVLESGVPFIFISAVDEFGKAIEEDEAVIPFCIPPRVPPCENIFDFYLKE